MNKRIKNILRCYAAGMGIKKTADTFHTSRNTVRKYVRLFLSSGKSIDQLLSLSDEQLHVILAVRNPGIVNLLPGGLNWRPCFPSMYPACHVRGLVSENCSRNTMRNILTVTSCLLSNGLSASTSFTSRLSVMSNTMPQTRCTLILPATGLKSLTG